MLNPLDLTKSNIKTITKNVPKVFYEPDYGQYYFVNKLLKKVRVSKTDIPSVYEAEYQEPFPYFYRIDPPAADMKKMNSDELDEARKFRQKNLVPNGHIIFAPQIDDEFFYFEPEEMLDGKFFCINKFIPTQYMLQEVDKTVKELPERIKLLFGNLFGEDKELQDHFINWFAYIFVNRKKTLTSWLFRGAQGTGKGLLMNQIITPLLGGEQTRVAGTHKLAEQFNSFVEDSSFIVFDEVKTDKWNKDIIESKIKQLITDEVIEIRAMRKDSSKGINQANYMFFSNVSVPFSIEGDDRRITVVQGNVAINENKWFGDTFVEGLAKELTDFASYLNNLKINTKKVNRVVNNKAKQILVEMGGSYIDTFCTALKDLNKDFFDDVMDGDAENKQKDNSAELLFEFSGIWDEIKKSKVMPAKMLCDLYRAYNQYDNRLSNTAIAKKFSQKGIDKKALWFDDKTVKAFYW